MRMAGLAPNTDAPLLAVERRAAVLPVFTAATIVLGLLALFAVTAAGALPAAIAAPGVAEEWARPAGVVLWTLMGLAGALRIVRGPSGHGVLTFHLPFIVAAMVLGGPIAGGWVALLASFDRRELGQVPWYGVLANHTGLAGAAGLGGLTAQAVTTIGIAAGLPDGLALMLVAAVAATLVFSVVSTALAAGVIVLRDGLTVRETLFVFNGAFRGTAVAETLLGWLFVVLWLAVGWWAPPLCAALVLAIWRVNEAEEERDRDELTGVLSRRAFAVRVAEAADRGRRGIEGAAYLFLDLDGFKLLNDGPRDHDIGDEVLAELGARLRRSIRVTDAAGRRGGDEFMVLFLGVGDAETAMRLAQRIQAAITAPYQTAAGEKTVGVSIGIALITPGRREFEPDLRQRADAAMYDAKQAGGGIVLGQEPAEA